MTMKMGTFEDKDGYHHALLSDESVMDEYMDKQYCVINLVSHFARIPGDDKVIPKHEIDTFYSHDEVKFNNIKIIAKVKDGKWERYD